MKNTILILLALILALATARSYKGGVLADDEFIVQPVHFATDACDAAVPSLKSEVDALAANVRALLKRVRECGGSNAVPSKPAYKPRPDCTKHVCPLGAASSLNAETKRCECRYVASPGTGSTPAPTNPPATNAQLPTDAPTNPPATNAQLPTDAPTNPPATNAQLPTDAPTNPPATNAQLPTDAPTNPPATNAQLPTDAPPPTAAPTARPTAAPTNPPATNAPAAPQLRTAVVAGATVLTDNNGATLYINPGMGPNDCTVGNGCVAVWPILAPGSISGPNIGSVNTEDGPVATYKGQKLYRFATDSVGRAKGDGQNGFQKCTP